ncbi:hypothetical protein, variant [Cryptococcus amylolentus CBS 6039]|uniref:MYND-type domain-containing protein n=1 Tax=Cryptococcus amylolentus CBS 6039 TaxID=1295533 RepID=A0A1E3I4C4_9TREE|nr:hypothetical protein L202_01620 [Cryptococcus amylolentus CBS 6039]XP_018997484.1 hypothetical protein, variant [Cryptococcus amylolentus CBS 6039]ODN83483.1 hypothetical protein L202_01620 [Cryptococcus amylolentus CBS 6039]ODN83484.1 hypothetical protein, variant [Cryptococcus amylolentus CBS 6039]
MRESNITGPPQNRAVTVITSMIYDRRALDTNSPLALLNSLTALTSLTATSPRIREILTIDGGLERLLDILRESSLPKEVPVPQDLWGLNGPPTARVITMERANSLKHSLAFQCVVNVGVRGSENVRTRVVQSGTLDIVAQIIESWLKDHGISIHSGPLGSQAAVDAFATGVPLPGTDSLRRKEKREGREERDRDRERERERDRGDRGERGERSHRSRTVHHHHQQAEEPTPTATIGRGPPGVPLSTDSTPDPAAPQPRRPFEEPDTTLNDTDVDMADADVEGGESTDASMDADDLSVDVDMAATEDALGSRFGASQPSTTPRAATTVLPMSIPSTSRQGRERDTHSGGVAESLSGDDAAPSAGIPRITSESNLAASNPGIRPPTLTIGGPSRLPHLAQDPTSTQSSPMATPPPRQDGESVSSGASVRHGRRGTIIARPGNLAPRNDRERELNRGNESGQSDGGEDMDLPTATIAAGIAAVNAQAMENNGPIVPDEPGPPPNVEIVETTGAGQEELEGPDPEVIAAEQARLDMEAGAPPGQPGAAQTPRVAPTDAQTPRQAPGQGTVPAVEAQIIIANGAPRSFDNLGNYVGISSLLNPDGNRYSDDSILLALQLFAYLSKYPHLRSAFHHPRRPIHATFDYGDDWASLAERPGISETPDIFSLVERLTFRPSPSDPVMFKVPPEIQYWAGVIMRNSCRKDDARGGIRQCANMSCGRWEKYSREFAKCRRCRKAKYCSKECQSRAWQEGHRFWCSTSKDHDPAQIALEGSSRHAPPQAGRGGDDDEDYQIGLQMGLSPEVVSRALAAARAAGIIPQRGQEFIEGDGPEGLTGPTTTGTVTPAGNTAATTAAVTPTRATTGPAVAPSPHAPRRQVEPGQQVPPRVAEAWARFQNVGTFLGIRSPTAPTTAAMGNNDVASGASTPDVQIPEIFPRTRPQPPPALTPNTVQAIRSAANEQVQQEALAHRVEEALTAQSRATGGGLSAEDQEARRLRLEQALQRVQETQRLQAEAQRAGESVPVPHGTVGSSSQPAGRAREEEGEAVDVRSAVAESWLARQRSAHAAASGSSGERQRPLGNNQGSSRRHGRGPGH